MLLIGRVEERLINSKSLLLSLPTPAEGHVPDASWYLEGCCFWINVELIVEGKLKVEFKGLAVVAESILLQEASWSFSKNWAHFSAGLEFEFFWFTVWGNKQISCCAYARRGWNFSDICGQGLQHLVFLCKFQLTSLSSFEDTHVVHYWPDEVIAQKQCKKT